MTYAEKLRDPRWQRKRLEILERDGWRCAHCDATDRTLHVHHGFFLRGVDPWDYPAATLSTLCEDCHSATTALHQELAIELAVADGANCGDIERILGYARALRAERTDSDTMPVAVHSYEQALGFGDLFWLKPEAVIRALEGTATTLGAMRSLQQRPTA